MTDEIDRPADGELMPIPGGESDAHLLQRLVNEIAGRADAFGVPTPAPRSREASIARYAR